MPTAAVEPVSRPVPVVSSPARWRDQTGRSPVVAVAGTRMWAEARARRALQEGGMATLGADEVASRGPAGPGPDVVLLVRTENSPVATAREATVLAGLPDGALLVVVGRVGFHPFEHRVNAEFPLERMTATDLSAVAGEVRSMVQSLATASSR